MSFRQSQFYKKLALVKKCILDFLNVLYIKMFHADYIIVNCWAIQRFGRIRSHNFGDDINIPLIEGLTGKKVLVFDNLLLKKCNNLLCIGSIIDTHSNELSEIWGSGILYGDQPFPLSCKPKHIYAVRGKLTQSYLLKHGIDCPSVYGDPALLLPYLYDKPVSQTYLFGIIPHFTELEYLRQSSFVKSNSQIHIIDLVNYKNWKDVVDEIRSCKYILSSSLHGLIISDAYKVPNIHVKFSNRVNGGDFKYRDYYSGINKQYEGALDFTQHIDLKIAEARLANYMDIEYDCSQLLEVFPFELTAIFKKLFKSSPKI